MTVIIGINLTDRLQIAADTRVSKILQGKVVPQHDNMLKVINVGGVVIACAGDAGLASHVLRALSTEMFINRGIDVVRQHIEEWIIPVAEEYWKQRGETTHATFIIGGRTTHRRKWVSRERLQMMMDAYSNDPDVQGQLGRMHRSLFEALKSNQQYLKLPFSDTALFSVSISFQGVSVEDAEWGQHLIYGPSGVSKSDVPLSYIARLEFEDKADSNETMLITAYIYDLVQKKKLESVGSTVITVTVGSNGVNTLISGGVHMLEEVQGTPKVKTISDIKVVGGKLYRIEEGKEYLLAPVSEYQQTDKAALIL
jgi:hypothetical protein